MDDATLLRIARATGYGIGSAYDALPFARMVWATALEDFIDAVDDACELMELNGMHDESDYRRLKNIVRECKEQMAANAEITGRASGPG